MQEMISITWDHLYDELVTFVERRVKDKPTAEDIVQEVFIKVQQKSSQLQAADKIIHAGYIRSPAMRYTIKRVLEILK